MYSVRSWKSSCKSSRKPRPSTSSQRDTIRRALFGLTHYLDALADGATNATLRLFHEYQELLQARGVEMAFDVDLFFPSLQVELPEEVLRQPQESDAPARIKAARLHYQQSLLKWLRQDGTTEALRTMMAAVRSVLACVPQNQQRAFWWVSLGLLDCLVQEGVPFELNVKKSLSRIDLKMKSLMDESAFDDEAAMSEALYIIARSHTVSDMVEQIKNVYELDVYLPQDLPMPPGESAALLDSMREQLNAAEESWEHCVADDAGACRKFAADMEKLYELSEQLDRNTLQFLSKQIQTAALHAEEPERAQRISMDMAMALLLLDSGISHYQHLGSGFQELARILSSRLQAGMMRMPEDVNKLANLVSLYCQMEQHEVMVPLASEMQGNLQNIEQNLNAFFNNAAKRTELTQISRLLSQVQGGLHILSLDVAVELLVMLRQVTERYVQGETPSAAEMRTVAAAVSTLEEYVHGLVLGQKSDPSVLSSVLREIAEMRSAGDYKDAAVHEESASPAGVSIRTGGEDEELLEVFLEEAREVMETLRSNLEISRVNMDNREPLVTMRRGFHTLKGSGRMVGLTELGEVAWAVERAMNKWLQENKPATPALLDMIGDAEVLFQHWVDMLRSGSTTAVIDTSYLLKVADCIENGKELPQAEAGMPEAVSPAAPAELVTPESREEDQVVVGSVTLSKALFDIATEEAAGHAHALREQLAVLHESDAHIVTYDFMRAAHTLAGVNRTMGFVQIAELAYALELWLEERIDKPNIVDEQQTALIDQVVQRLDEMCAMVREQRQEPPAQAELIAELQASKEVVATAADAGVLSALGLELPAIAAESAVEPAFAPEITLDFAPASESKPAEEPALPELELPLAAEAFELPGAAVAEESKGPAEPAFMPEITLDFAPAAESQPAEIEEPSAQEFELPVIAAESAAEAAFVPEITLDFAPAAESAPAETGAAQEPPESTALIAVESPEEDQVTVGAVSLSRVLFDIATEEAVGNVHALREQLAVLHESDAHTVSYDFMRAAHTLAGVNRTMGFVQIAELAYALELWLEERIDKPRIVDAQQMELIDRVVQRLDEMCAMVREQRQEPPVQVELIAELQASKELAAMPEAPAAMPEIIPALGFELPAEPAVSVAAPELAMPMESQPAASKPHVEPEAKKVTATTDEEEPAPRPAQRERAVHDEVDEQLLPIFLEEAHELYPQIGSTVRAWREEPGNAQLGRNLQRSLHTLKGSARMAGAMRLGELTHRVEDRVDKAAAIGGMNAEFWNELDNYLDRIGNAIEQLQHPQAEVPETAEQPAAAHGAQQQFETTQAVPKQMLEVGAERAMQTALLRVRSDTVDRLVNEAGEVSVARSRAEMGLRELKGSALDLTESVNRLRKQLREIEIHAEGQMQARVTITGDSAEKFDPLEFDRFTRFQELTRFMNESVHDVQTVQQTLLKNLAEAEAALTAQSHLNRDLQQGLMSIRMVPFASLSERLYRIVRQTGKELGKRVNLELSGTEVELDRSVLERMTAPFEHLLRNAVAHGLETPEQRERAGKDLIGEIRLALRQESNEVVFELSDDGAGLDIARVKQKAVENGVLQEGEEISDELAMQLIFTPGLSTAQEVTEISGRGVGMDVVRSEITALGGRIDVASALGQGVRFTIHLPLTLAVTKTLMVRAGQQIYALPSTMIENVQQLKPAALQASYKQQYVEWQGSRYPLHYMARLLGDDEAEIESQPYNPVLQLRSGDNRIAVHVDELLGNQEAVVKNIGPQLARLPGIAGATVSSNGTVILILDPIAFTQRIVVARKTAKPAVVVEEVHRAPSVMVVDDSLTVRKITSRLLARAGYQVLTAKDGVDALEQLAEVLPDVMLLDVEMPRMDGFELTKHLRQDSRTQDLPIIMITSRTADKHRHYALELGVNEYMGKPFQEDELLANIARFVHS